MRATYKTSRLTKRGAQTFDVGVMTDLAAVVPNVSRIKECKLNLPSDNDAQRETPPPVAEVRWHDENGDVRFTHDVTATEAHRLHEFFKGIVESLR